MEYLVIYEKGESGGYGAYAPDLPGCVAVAETLEECRPLMKEAIEFHIAGLREDGDPIPSPTLTAEMVDVQAA